MPELPEVETVRRGLDALIVGRVVKSVAVRESPKSFPNVQADVDHFLLGAKIIAVRRRAKVLLVDLSTEYTLVIHLKMTGQLVFIGATTRQQSNSQHAHARRSDEASASLQAVELPMVRQSSLGQETDASSLGLTRNATHHSAAAHQPKARHSELVSESIPNSETRFGAGHPNDSLIGELPDRSTRVVIEFQDGSHLYFNDQRKFGWVKLYPTLEVPNIDFMQKVGPEPLEKTFTAKEFIPRVRRRAGTTIKAAILDQTVLAGVGNIYADESLWGARIHPATRVKNVSEEQLTELLKEIKYVMNLSIEKGGSTDRNYVNAEGKRGSYIDFARVFRREGLSCPRHPEVMIEKSKVAGRGTHICPVCQVLTK